jgi:hypothetical protein
MGPFITNIPIKEALTGQLTLVPDMLCSFQPPFFSVTIGGTTQQNFIGKGIYPRESVSHRQLPFHQ